MFTVRFPFRLEDTRSITNHDLGQELQLGNLTISLVYIDPQYVLFVKGLKSEKEAEAMVHYVWFGLIHMMLKKDIAFRARLILDNPIYPVDPVSAAQGVNKAFGTKQDRVDVWVDGNLPSFYPSDLLQMAMTLGDANFNLGTPASIVIPLIAEGIKFGMTSIVVSDEKLRTALDLYRAHFFEQSRTAKLLTLIMALECLAPKIPKHQVALDLLAQWKIELDKMKETVLSDADATDALISLGRELDFRGHSSLRSQIRALVKHSTTLSDQSTLSDQAKRIVEIYDLRSALVHDGTADELLIEQAYQDCKDIAQLVLLTRIGGYKS